MLTVRAVSQFNMEQDNFYGLLGADIAVTLLLTCPP